MIRLFLDYATPSSFESQKERALLGLSADGTRQVRFKGKVKTESTFLLRTVLRTLGDVIWSPQHSVDFGPSNPLDPVITVHPDHIFLEVFSQDQGVHALVTLDRELFETEGKVLCGTSNIDYTSWLWGALGEMRSSRTTWFQIDNTGLELKTVGAGGRFEKRVEIPHPWLRGFLEVQAACSLPGTRLKLRPVDLLSVIRFLRYTKPRMQPRGLRYEFEPDQEARIVLEPWEESFRLKGTEHNYDKPKVTRLWGRQRLSMLEPLLPFADEVEVFLKGRALPSFYVVRLPGIEFTLSLSGWAGKNWMDGAHSRLTQAHTLEEDQVTKAEELLAQSHHISRQELCQRMEVEKPIGDQLLTELCRRGLAFYRPGAGRYRHRRLFTEALDMTKVFPVDPIVTKAQDLVKSEQVKLLSTTPRETRKVKKLQTPRGKELKEIIYRDWCLEGEVAEHKGVEVVLNDVDRIIFGKCTCDFFQRNLLNKGPCEHMLALRDVGLAERQELPTSQPAEDRREELE